MAKIPFNIKYRPQIESGEYKVETGDKKPVRIICWNRKVNDFPIVALAYSARKDAEIFVNASVLGEPHTNIASDRLFLITPEEELTEFEKVVKDRLWKTLEYSDTFRKDENKWVRELASELLTLAEREIVNRVAKECYKRDFCIEDTIKFNEGYKLGKELALRDLPRWEKWGSGACCGGQGIPLAIVKRGLNDYELVNSLSIPGEQYIMLYDLEKLPGFKEDEK